MAFTPVELTNAQAQEIALLAIKDHIASLEHFKASETGSDKQKKMANDAYVASHNRLVEAIGRLPAEALAFLQ